MAKHNCAICGAEIGLLTEQKLALMDQKEASDKKVAELTQALEAAQKALEEAKNQPAAAAATSSEDGKDKELALLMNSLLSSRQSLARRVTPRMLLPPLPRATS